ncbi:hypothetical protein OQ968_22595 [Mycobacterium sp. 663a-19]|uniref:hypothetical protein n=1 Tax=Mycobacterium sp. 663a-19 TaxID=2986148 RepID=UPI002D1ED45A|nr:hypothetical protein [Mycobacterium sp. 663a-19]MEB3984041.1 hypothetical protein [Mycobacterium sp. 663a-19]
MSPNRPDAGRSHAAMAPVTPSLAAAPTDSFAIGRTRGARIRRTVDLSAGQHRALDTWQREAADRLGVARVTGQEVLTALIDQLLSDPRLSVEIIRSLQARR